jgi:hypothetical protein
MTERDVFESRLHAALVRHVANGPTDFDALAFARTVAAKEPRRRGLAASLTLRGLAFPRRAWVLLLLAGLLAALVAGTLLVGSLQERRLPAVVPPVAPSVAPSIAPAFVCPAGSTPDKPGPGAQVRPALGGGTYSAFDRRAGRLVAFGPTLTNFETWTFDTCTNAWTQMHPDRAPDSASGLVYDVDSDATIGVFSGTVWAYDLGADAWTEKGRAPIDARLVAYDPGSGLVVAAPAWESRTANAVQLWSYDIATDTWARIGEASAQAAGSRGEAYAYDASVDRLIVYSVNESANQTWLFDLRAGTWARSGADTPTVNGRWGMATYPPAIVYDEGAKRTVVGGPSGRMAAYEATADRWEYLVGGAEPGQDWATRFGPASQGGGDVYDAVNRRLIGGGEGNSLWAFDPANRQWTVLLEGEAGTEPTDRGFGPFVPAQPGSAPDLEAMLPSDVNGVTFTKTSVVGGIPSTRLGKGGWGRVPLPADMLGEFLHAYGRTLADLNIAISIPTDASRADTFCIAFRVKGADATELAATLATISGLEAVTATVGGKQVQVFRETGGMGFDLYIKGDVVFYVFTDGSPLADEIVAALP